MGKYRIVMSEDIFKLLSWFSFLKIPHFKDLLF